MKIDVLFARFPHGASEHPDTSNWMIETMVKAKADERIGHALHCEKDDTPVTMSRNWVVEQAKKKKVDVLVMIDSDMKPDLAYAGAKPFWDSSLEFLLKHHGPCAIGAPYCGPPPIENIYVFQWGDWTEDHKGESHELKQYSREQAATLAGIQLAGALPTGLIMIHMDAFKQIEPPYFYYEYTDSTQSEKASTEDVTFTRDLTFAGVPVYCNWDSWAGHHKRKCVMKPTPLTIDMVSAKYKEAILRNHPSNKKLIVLGEGTGNGRPAPVLRPNLAKAVEETEEAAK
jgi:hypothetical protein